MEQLKLYMLLLGCKPEGRHTEQHDVFFHIGESLESLIPAMVAFWPEAKGKIHVDAWRTVTRVGDFSVTVRERGADEGSVGEAAGDGRSKGAAAGGGSGDEATTAGGVAAAGATASGALDTPPLYFINLGGYKKDVFEEFHYKMIAVAEDKGAAIRQAKDTAFYQHTGFKGATSHVDDKYGIDVDDAHEIADILPASLSAAFTIDIQRSAGQPIEGPVFHPGQEDEMHLGYFQLTKLKGIG